MIKLEELQDPSPRKRRTKLLGRGPSSGHGKTSCRGHKGDGSRSGYKRRFGYEGGGIPLYRRMPTRGFSHLRFDKCIDEITTQRLNSLFSDGDAITLEALKNKKAVSKHAVKVKVIFKGELDKTFIWNDSKVVLSQGVANLIGVA
ncbi:50S ribosomal protein L15 [Chlamydia avium]|uniref:Large ribosomal subunit protein uL15 n=2 Tax=Chlamydia avium TaxID=1457141 RepID=W8JNA6_9CHLA|nr:50S ribosomal protein L15 [Chlamydia avium]AHK63759.1 50S ribosomal protein L15 [Chlamydia avium 10DC88]EPP36335.1 ribosomal protein L15 [Chlamydia psittaci 10_743_SC13]EPP38792.1 ribosomal protein L15 [Chlamydia avium]VVT43340.1 50S ribosomal protein L15 [Chlamydia avium]